MKIGSSTDRPIGMSATYGSQGVGDVARTGEDVAVKESKTPKKVNKNLSRLLDSANVKFSDSTTRGNFQKIMNKISDRMLDHPSKRPPSPATVDASELADPSEGYKVSPSVTD